MPRFINGLIVWLVATIFVVYSFCLNTAAAVFSDVIKSSLHVNDVSASLATGAFILGFACMQIPAGYLLDRYSAKFIVSTGVLLLALGNICISYADNVYVFALSNFLQGLGASFAFISVAILISQWFSVKLFPILFGLSQTISCVLTGVIHYYLTLALATHAWSDIYRDLGIFGLALFVLCVLLVKTPANYYHGKNISLIKSLKTVLKNKQIILCAFAAATSFGTLLAYASYWYAQVQVFYHVEHLQAVLISSMVFLGVGVGTPLMGWLSNKIKSRIIVVHASLALGAMALILEIYFPRFAIESLILIKAMSFLTGFFLSGAMLFYTMVSERATETTRGVAISVLNTMVFLFNTILLFIPYLFITSISRDFFTYLWVLPFCVLISLLLMTFIKDTFKK